MPGGERVGVGALKIGDVHLQQLRGNLTTLFVLAIPGKLSGQEEEAHDVLGVLAKVLAQEGRYDEALDVGAASLAIAERTDLLDLRGSVHLDLAESLSLAARPTEATPHIEQALELYEQKSNVVSAARARALLAETVEVL